MERADELLNKYFEGMSTLGEEKELKAYFKGENISEKHLIYKPLFLQFTAESEESSPSISPIHQAEKPKYRRNKILVLTISSIAACLLAIAVIRTPSQSDDYIISKGKRIDNPELAQRMAQKKLEKSLAMVSRRLEPMETLGKVENKMEKIEKINQIRQDIHHKLSTKK